MGYITEIKIQCIQQDDTLGSDDLEFLVDSTSVGHVHIRTGESKDVTGSTMLFDHGFVDPGNTIKVQVDHLLSANDLLLSHTVTADELQNGLHATSASGCSCSYVFDFTFEPSI
jgi:hypothetical protein